MEYDVVVWQGTLSDGSICYAAICPAIPQTCNATQKGSPSRRCRYHGIVFGEDARKSKDGPGSTGRTERRDV